MSTHGFASVWGRGYRPEQVDQRIAALAKDCEDAWERVERLTAQAERMETESALLAERVAALEQPTYDNLGRRAQQILALAKAEDETVRREVREECQAVLDAAQESARRLRDAARERSEEIRAAAEAHASEATERALDSAEDIRGEARTETEAQRAESLDALTDVRRRTQRVIDDLEKKHGEMLAADDREFDRRGVALEAESDALVASAEARLVETRRMLSEAGEQARHRQEDAQDTAAELMAQARVRAERVMRDTERLVREHEETREEMRAHMAHVRNSLAALTGRAPTAD
ncbi:cellulose-binding protein [Streptomyces paludis]|uniref:Cellulose-binding protein n=1 Tax=Streptomyces paludis TaxID=2282738 RepID=A0A345HSL6_9ACTN|nr:cellulose-binding protein [Streptomyces paludis]